MEGGDSGGGALPHNGPSGQLAKRQRLRALLRGEGVLLAEEGGYDWFGELLALRPEAVSHEFVRIQVCAVPSS